jgi:hypothetical protein
MPPGKGNLPHLANEASGWGHPVFGRSGVARGDWTWVREWGKPHWFEEPITRSAGDVKRAAQQAIDDVKKMLD